MIRPIAFCAGLALAWYGAAEADDTKAPAKPECPTRPYYDSGLWPPWEDLTPDQVKKCMRAYWSKRVEDQKRTLSDQQNTIGEAQWHLGMWQ